MKQAQTQLERRHKTTTLAGRVLRRVSALLLLGAAAALCSEAQTTVAVTPQYAGIGCTATIQNRAALVDGNGTYTLPNVPEPFGKYRVHITCPQPDGTTMGAVSDAYSLVDGLGIPLLALDVPSPAIQTLTMQVQSGQLNALGATAQLSVVGVRSDGAPLEETQASTGTTYITSNPAVATVSADGLVTAKGPGAVSISAGNDGLTATMMMNSFASLDSDGDGMPDIWEIANGLNPYDPTDAAQDPDGDGLTNLQEYQLGTNPHVADTDGDGLSDGKEVALGTNPLVADTDGDGLTDGQEVALGTNPLVADTDGDGIPDGVEVKIGTNPLVADVTTSVAGHVTNPNGTPSAGTSVVVLTYFTTVTDSTGAFTVLHVPVTLGNIVASAEAVVSGAVYSGSSASTVPVSSGITDVGTVQLGQSSGQVSGTVYTPDNKPDAGAVVTVISGMDTRTAVTNGTGVYTVSGLQSGTVAVAAIDPTTSLRGQVTGTLIASVPLTLNVTLGGFGTVSGTVLDVNGKAVGAGIAVTIIGALMSSTVTDTLGHYSFPFVPLGGVTVDATDAAGDHGRTTGTVTATAQTINANVQFLGRGTVSGKVTDGTGTAVAGATVQLSNYGIFTQNLTATTDSVGQYSIANVFIGSLNLTATSTATSTAGTTTASLTTNGQTVTANIMLQPTGTISGTVYRANGTTPVAGALVTLQYTALTATASASGTYSVPNVPLGTYAVRATDPASNDRGQAPATLSTAGQTVARNISMLGVGTVKATVVDGGGVPTAGALVNITSNDPFYQSQNGVSGSDGTVTFSAEIAGTIAASAKNPVNGLGGTASVTLTAGSTTNVTVTLQSAGTVHGTVYRKDGVTPVAGLTLILDDNQQGTTSAADGTYSFSNVVVGTHTIAVFDATGNRLSYSTNVVVSTQGQVVTANFVIVGRGTVTGHVTNPNGSAAQGVAVEVRSAGGTGGIYGTSTDVNGLYTASLVPVGGYLVVAQQHTTTTNSYGSKSGNLASDGATATTDVQLSTSLVPSTLSVTDANGESYPVRENGGLFDGSFSIFAGDGGTNRGASLLSITQGPTTVPFTGEDLAPVDLNGRQISLTQTGLAGLNVTRRVYVPADGYFARYIELLNNPGASAVTVGVTLTSNFRPVITDTLLSTGTQVTQDVPHVLLTTSGDNVINVNDPITPDTWATVGGATDRDPFVSDPFADTPIPAVGYVFYGPGASIKPSLIVYGPDYTGAFSTLKETYSSITVPAGGTVALLHFISQQNMYAPANASAVRLVQLPPESIAGIAPADLAAIGNFVMPANGTSTVAALPSTTNEVTGHVYAADSVTPVPYANVRFQSTDPIFARDYATNSDSLGSFTFQGSLGGLAVAPDPFSVVALEPNSATAQTSTCVQAGLLTGNGCGILSPVYTGTFASGVNVAQKDIVFSNTGILRGTVSRGPTVLNVAGTVTLTGGAMTTVTVPVRSDGTYSFVDVLPGTYSLVANVTNTLLTGTATSAVTAGQITTTNITIGGAGVISGQVTRPDGSLAVSATVNLRATGQSPLTTVADTAGHYQFTDIPIGTYTLDCFDSFSNSSATAKAVVTANTTTTTNLLLQSAGTVVGTVTANDGSSVANIPVTLTSTTSSGTQSLSTSTNATGGFTFNSVKPGALTLHATNSDGLQGTSTGNLPLAGQTITVNIALLAAGNLTGTVFLGDGTTPAAGATVTLEPAPLTGSATTTANGSGVYSFANVRLGSFTVYASNAATGDRGQATGQIQANGQQRTINVSFTGFGSLTVKVLSANSTPVANSTVQVSAAYGTTFNGTTDLNGQVNFASVFASSYYVTAKDPATGYSSSNYGTLAYKANSTITVTLQSLANIQGTVFGVDGTTPVSGIKVVLSGNTNKTATTGADGTFQFPSVPTGYFNLTAIDANNFTRASSGTFPVITSGATVTQNLILVGVGSVTGTVTNTDGSVVQNIPLTLTSQNAAVGGTYTTNTGGDGTYKFSEVPVGKFTVTVGGLPAGQIGYGFGSLAADGGTTVVNIQIQGNAITLPITLTDADGFGYKLYGDGMFYAADALTPFSSAQPLLLTVGSTTQEFGFSTGGSQVNTAAIQTLSGQGIELTAPVERPQCHAQDLRAG